MAKRDEQKANQNGYDSGGIKVRVIEFELHGRNATVSEGIKAITDAISNRTVVVSEPQRPALPAIPKHEALVTTIDVEKPEEPDTSHTEIGSEETSATNLAGGNGTGSKRKYSYRTPKYLSDLDITKAKKNLQEFVEEKNPPNVQAKYLVIVYWFLKYMDIAEVTIDHVYTVFDVLGWKAEMPSNPSVPLRDLKSKSNMLTREPKAEGYKLNFKGEQEVEKMK